MTYGRLKAVNDISFNLGPGQLLGLVGPNGAGKTTLLRVIAGLQVPNTGRTWIMKNSVLGRDPLVRRHVAFAPDNPPVYEDLTIEQYLRFIGGAYDLAAREIEERIDFWLENLWLVNKRQTRVRELSRGMRQRVSLARCFLPSPHVLLLDEPLSGLDPAGRVELRRVLGMLRDQGCAMVVSSHILSDLEEVATHIGIIEHGCLKRFSETAALHADAGGGTYEITLLEDRAAALVTWLESQVGVTGLNVDNRTVRFDFSLDEHQVASLLRSLINEGFDAVSFVPVKRTLEQAYLKAGLKQVD
ncbi:MAG: ABC transporter ATP-binding protein [Phycisphaerae bacterium]